MSYVVNTVKGTMANALTNFAKELNIPIVDARITIYTEDENECTPKYRVYNKTSFVKEVTFDEILNVKLDFLGREQIASPFLAETIKKMAKENNCKANQTVLMILAYSNEKPEPYVLLYCNNQFIRDLSFEDDIFNGI